MNKRHLFRLCIVITGVVQLFYCSQTEQKYYDGQNKNKSNLDFQHIETGDSITISWDSPTGDLDSISHYELYYHTPKDTAWICIKDNVTGIAQPSVVVLRKDIESADSLFYFAVCTVGKNGKKSDVHTSSDSNAVPSNWILLWKRRT